MECLGIVPGVRSPRTFSVIEYPIGISGQSLVLTDEVLEHLMKYRQRGSDSREAGGQLFARFDGNIIRIECATGPRLSDRRHLMSFVPSRLAERREIKRLFKDGLHYIGDWHTHPELRPKPSRTDIDSIQDLFKKSRHKLASFVMIIVGTARRQESLFVGIFDNNNWQQLRPISGESESL
jgi:integrative and conjugative element protein (TIGR02256 family)